MSWLLFVTNSLSTLFMLECKFHEYTTVLNWYVLYCPVYVLTKTKISDFFSWKYVIVIQWLQFRLPSRCYVIISHRPKWWLYYFFAEAGLERLTDLPKLVTKLKFKLWPVVEFNFWNGEVRTSKNLLLYKSSKNTGKIIRSTFSELWKLKLATIKGAFEKIACIWVRIANFMAV